MICPCPKCGELRTCVNLANNGVTCWHCLSEIMFEPSDHEPPPAVLEGVRCMRVAERTDGEFGMFFAEADANRDVFIACSFTSWGMSADLAVRPVIARVFEK